MTDLFISKGAEGILTEGVSQVEMGDHSVGWLYGLIDTLEVLDAPPVVQGEVVAWRYKNKDGSPSALALWHDGAPDQGAKNHAAGCNVDIELAYSKLLKPAEPEPPK